MSRTRWIDESLISIKGDRATVNRDTLNISAIPKLKAMKPKMNKLETRYFQYLSALKFAGEIRDFRFEPFRLKLAEKCTYCPDFFVVTKDGAFEVHETKGFMRDDAAVKLKVAAENFPWWQFKVIRWVKGQWEVRPI